MKVTLTIFGEPTGRRIVTFYHPGEHVIGRSKNAGVPLQHSLIAPEHCELVIEESRVLLRDLGAGTTEINGVKMPPGGNGAVATPVESGSEIELGSAVSVLLTTQADLTEADKFEMTRADGLELLKEAGVQLAAALALKPGDSKLTALIENLRGAGEAFRAVARPAPPEPKPKPSPETTGGDDGPADEGSDPVIREALRSGFIPGINNLRIRGVVARGKIATILEAERIDTGERVALKLIEPSSVKTKKLDRFIQEGQILSKLDHPGLVRALDVGAIEGESGPRPYQILELVHGQSLLQYAEERGLDTRERLEILERVCEALAYVHRQGVIHRGLKPTTILVDSSGQPRILDFGMARLNQGDSGLTTRGKIVGVLAYLSPEQTQSESDLDERVDIYALGGIGYTLLARKPPLELQGKNLFDALTMIKETVPQPLGAINPAWRGSIERIFAKALEKQRERRYASASEIGAEIRLHLAREADAAKRVEAFTQAAHDAPDFSPPSQSRDEAPGSSKPEEARAAKPGARFPAARPVEPDPMGIPQLPEYQILSQIAKGRISTIHEVEHVGLKRRFALKVYQTRRQSETALQRFEREGVMLRELDHPGIVKFVKSAFYRTPKGEVPYHVMELVEGRPLLVYTDNERLDLGGRLDVLIGLCDAAQYMHSRGVVHRDLKPANILMEKSGQPKILDFGVARFALGGDGAAAPAPGTPAAGSELDPRADVFGIAGIGYTLLTGQTPTASGERDLEQVLHAIQIASPRPLGDSDSGFGARLEKIFSKALAKQREERYATAGELGADLKAARAALPATGERARTR